MDTGISEYRIPPGVDRSQLPRYEHERDFTSKGGRGEMGCRGMICARLCAYAVLL